MDDLYNTQAGADERRFRGGYASAMLSSQQ